MSKTFMTVGEGSAQTLSELDTDKMPVYDSMVDVESDLANLEVGQIVAIKDTGEELSNPVNVVEEGNLHAVTSAAVANSCTRFPDYASGSLITSNISSYTPTEDCFVVYATTGAITTDNLALLIDGVQVTSHDGGTSPAHIFSFSGYVKKGSVLTRKDGGNFTPSTLKIFNLS